ncbi:MAG: O-antigen ligase family protein [Actinomycetota bacterium]|nr:O-antigen ligase family protein [Actinomycetota bacterium]
MSTIPLGRRHPSVHAWVVLLGCLVAAVLGVGLGSRGTYGQELIVFLVAGAAAGVAMVLRPVYGLGLFAAAASITDILPSVSFASSALVLLGAGAFFAFIVNYLLDRELALKWHGAHLAAIAFIAWFSATNLEFALHGPPRDWLLTYVQLFALVWLASQILSSPGRHRTLMWFFSAGAVASAAIALGQVAVSGSFNTSIRAAGLLGVNSSARYFAVAFVLLVYLATVSRGVWKLAAVGGAAMVVGGEAATLSRTGLLLLVLAVGILLWDRFRAGQRRQVVAVVGALAVAVLFIPKSYLSVELPSFQSEFSSSSGNDSTAIVRLQYWKAGYEMWLDHPIDGVGIGQYNYELPNYAPFTLSPKDLDNGAHNIYVAVLAETGLVGLLLYLWLVVASYSAVRRAHLSYDAESREIARTWQIALIVLLLGGLTKHDQYDKLLWMLFGACASFGAGYRHYLRRPAPAGDAAAPAPVG